MTEKERVAVALCVSRVVDPAEVVAARLTEPKTVGFTEIIAVQEVPGASNVAQFVLFMATLGCPAES